MVKDPYRDDYTITCNSKRFMNEKGEFKEIKEYEIKEEPKIICNASIKT